METKMTDRERWAYALLVLCGKAMADNARWLAHPVGEDGKLLPEQPSAEDTAERLRDAEGIDRMVAFYGLIVDADDAK